MATIFSAAVPCHRDDRSGVAHAASGRRGLSGDNRRPVLHVRANKLRGSLFCVAADFSDHDHGLSLRVAVEQIERVDKVRANYRISANADRRRLPDSALRQLMHRSYVSVPERETIPTLPLCESTPA